MSNLMCAISAVQAGMLRCRIFVPTIPCPLAWMGSSGNAVPAYSFKGGCTVMWGAENYFSGWVTKWFCISSFPADWNERTVPDRRSLQGVGKSSTQTKGKCINSRNTFYSASLHDWCSLVTQRELQRTFRQSWRGKWFVEKIPNLCPLMLSNFSMLFGWPTPPPIYPPNIH